MNRVIVSRLGNVWGLQGAALCRRSKTGGVEFRKSWVGDRMGAVDEKFIDCLIRDWGGTP